MNQFAYVKSTSAHEAARALAANPEARLMAGGVDLVHEMKQGIRTPSVVVHLADAPGLTGVTVEGDSLVIGALTKVAALESDPLVAEHAPLLAQAAREVATPQLRAMGTVAGNILQRPQCWYYRDPDSFCLRKGGDHCHAVAGDNRYHAILGGGPCHIVCPSDLAPALMALDARATVVSRDGSEREMTLADLFVGPRVDPHNEHVLAHGEVIARFTLPTSGAKRSSFVKARERTAWDFSLASAATLVELADDATVRSARIVLGGVAPNAWDAAEAAESLVGATLDDERIAAAGELAVTGARPLRDNAYKVTLAREVVVRALQMVRSQAGGA